MGIFPMGKVRIWEREGKSVHEVGGQKKDFREGIWNQVVIRRGE